ncbi:hypothetical protein CDAR_117141 [Caerostris darwini]|uniref:Uncharacterized protein n=1 Tax=Caerostris darwini TaxID=1538125 RepID=A0AAV4WTC3_9ARAC|nr:hypothetical protein CDAR_117141 [Caerostris darwini]
MKARTAPASIYAAGSVRGRLSLTHTGRGSDDACLNRGHFENCEEPSVHRSVLSAIVATNLTSVVGAPSGVDEQEPASDRASCGD